MSLSAEEGLFPAKFGLAAQTTRSEKERVAISDRPREASKLPNYEGLQFWLRGMRLARTVWRLSLGHIARGLDFH